MTASAFASLLVVWVAAVVSPGPDVVQVTRLGVRSKTAGMWAGVGIVTGTIIWMTASLLGLSALINVRPGILAVLQLIGGAYLLWMGAGALRAGLTAPTPGHPTSPANPTAADKPAEPAVGAARAWRIGTATNLSNPKALLFFGAVFAQFIRPDMGWGWTLLILVVLDAVALAWFLALAWAVRGLSRALLRNARIIDAITGLIFLALAVWMLVDGVRTLAG